jgi:hypothetical protein
MDASPQTPIENDWPRNGWHRKIGCGRSLVAPRQ